MSKILYAASSASHLYAFHQPYIKALRTAGHTVLTMAYGDGVDFDIPLDKKMLSPRNLRAIGKIRKILKAESFDLVILNTSLMAFLVRLALGRARPRVVNVVHGYLFPEKPVGLKARGRAALLLSAERILRKRTDAILTMNEEDLEIARANDLAPSVIQTLGMGVPERTARVPREEIRREYGAEDKLVLAFVGELSKRKNQSFLINALAKIRARGVDACLWLAGEGALRKRLEKRASALGCEREVVFLGKRCDVSDIMRAADVYVSAAAGEGLPFNIVEALASGCRVIASDVKGHRDILSGGAGELFSLSDEEKFISLVLSGERAPEEKISSAANRFSYENVFDSTLSALISAGNL